MAETTPDPEVDALVAAGNYGEAAAAARRHGDLDRAQRLLERIWDFRGAAEMARERGDRPELLRLLIEAREVVEVARLGEALAGAAPGEQQRAAEVYERHRLWSDAAGLRERLGQLEAARELYKRAQQPLEVARLDETLGRVREAGMAYERFLAAEPSGADAMRAHLELGRILAGFGRHEEAVRHLQRVLTAGAAMTEGPGADAMAPPGLTAAASASAAAMAAGVASTMHATSAGVAAAAHAATVTHTATASAASASAAASAAAAHAAIDGAGVTRAWRLLVRELAALGYREAARVAHERLRALDPAVGPLASFLAAPADAGPATRLAGRYRVARLLGSGGMGRVYLAHDELGDRDVAVKVVAPPVDERSQAGYRRFMREARVVSALRHPHIVGVVDFHEELGLLAMEHMAGGTLADRLPAAPRGLGVAAVRALLLQLLDALELAHAHGVIHRDLKPANIFFAASGDAKLGDFGVAHLQDLGATQTAGFIGTLAYMSPEQISGAPLSFAADVYALGVTAFQALTGRLPFTGPDFVGQHLGEPAPAPSSLAPELAAWDEPVARMLAKDPQARFASLGELRRALLAMAIAPLSAAELGLRRASEAAAETPAPARADERYLVDAALPAVAPGGGALYAGTDGRLGRPVVLALFAADAFDGEAGARHLAWLRALARHGGPRLQRVLRIERRGDGSTRVVYEALAGRAPRPPALDHTDAAALLGALAPLHADGFTHGSVAESVIVTEHGAALLVAGRVPAEVAVADERAAVQTLAD